MVQVLSRLLRGLRRRLQLQGAGYDRGMWRGREGAVILWFFRVAGSKICIKLRGTYRGTVGRVQRLHCSRQLHGRSEGSVLTCKVTFYGGGYGMIIRGLWKVEWSWGSSV